MRLQGFKEVKEIKKFKVKEVQSFETLNSKL